MFFHIKHSKCVLQIAKAFIVHKFFHDLHIIFCSLKKASTVKIFTSSFWCADIQGRFCCSSYQQPSMCFVWWLPFIPIVEVSNILLDCWTCEGHISYIKTQQITLDWLIQQNAKADSINKPDIELAGGADCQAFRANILELVIFDYTKIHITFYLIDKIFLPIFDFQLLTVPQKICALVLWSQTLQIMTLLQKHQIWNLAGTLHIMDSEFCFLNKYCGSEFIGNWDIINYCW